VATHVCTGGGNDGSTSHEERVQGGGRSRHRVRDLREVRGCQEVSEVQGAGVLLKGLSEERLGEGQEDLLTVGSAERG
jgi:hypothetical protein